MVANLVRFATLEQIVDQIICIIPMHVQHMTSVAVVSFKNPHNTFHPPPLKYVESIKILKNDHFLLSREKYLLILMLLKSKA